VVIADSDGKITFLNNAAREIYGLSNEILPEDIQDLGEAFTVEGDPWNADELPISMAVHRGETSHDQEWRVRRNDGKELWVQGSAAPLRDAAGASMGAVLTLRDVSQRKTMLLELERANQMKDDFLTILSHELRTPLTPLVGWISLLRSQSKAGKPMPPELLGQALEALEINIEQQKKIIEELLDASHLILGRAKFQKSEYPLTALVKESVAALEKSVSAKGIQFHLSLDPNIPPLPMDTARMGQAISHLISNAIEFSHQGGTIWICSQLARDSAVLEIRDEGTGIAPEFLPHIFDMFRQGDTPFTRRHGGLGMGLTLVKAIIEAHGGEISASSGGAGLGAALVVRLPLS
jgi:PAS domain S-box-containing protein